MASINSNKCTETTGLFQLQTPMSKNDCHQIIHPWRNESNGTGLVHNGATSSLQYSCDDSERSKIGGVLYQVDSSSHEKDEHEAPLQIPKGGSKLSQFSGDKKCLIIVCILSHFMSGLSTSLLAPFYPQVAREKGMPLTLIGLVFSLSPLLGFLLTPVFGSYLNKIGPKFLVVSGMFVGGSCNILYGTLDKCPDGTPFIVCSLVCRTIEGVGFAAYSTAMFAIVASEFSQRVGTALALIQTGCEVGLMLGPGVGGFLYELGGFGTPFYATGTVIVLQAVILYKVLPELQTESTDRNKTSKRAILTSGLVIAAIVSATGTATTFSFLESTLANHLQPLGLSTSMIGLVFNIIPCCFVILSPLYGVLTDSMGLQEHLIAIGQFIFGFGFYLVGPGSFFPFLNLEIWTVLSGLVLIGASYSACTVPNFTCAISGAMQLGLEDNADALAMITSLLNTTYFFGTLTGPLIGSFLVEQTGFRVGYTVMGSVNIIASLVCSAIFVFRHTYKQI